MQRRWAFARARTPLRTCVLASLINMAATFVPSPSWKTSPPTFEHALRPQARSVIPTFHASTGSGGRNINLLVEKICDVPPATARTAWLDCQWRKGGGLPVVVWS
eukprot:3938776-Rhodomonas_salina.2